MIEIKSEKDFKHRKLMKLLYAAKKTAKELEEMTADKNIADMVEVLEGATKAVTAMKLEVESE